MRIKKSTANKVFFLLSLSISSLRCCRSSYRARMMAFSHLVTWYGNSVSSHNDLYFYYTPLGSPTLIWQRHQRVNKKKTKTKNIEIPKSLLREERRILYSCVSILDCVSWTKTLFFPELCTHVSCLLAYYVKLVCVCDGGIFRAVNYASGCWQQTFETYFVWRWWCWQTQISYTNVRHLT